jgi:hypothetical protein
MMRGRHLPGSTCATTFSSSCTEHSSTRGEATVCDGTGVNRLSQICLVHKHNLVLPCDVAADLNPFARQTVYSSAEARAGRRVNSTRTQPCTSCSPPSSNWCPSRACNATPARIPRTLARDCGNHPHLSCSGAQPVCQNTRSPVHMSRALSASPDSVMPHHVGPRAWVDVQAGASRLLRSN